VGIHPDQILPTSYILDRIDDAGVWYGFERQDNDPDFWLIKTLTIDGAGLVTEVYANVGNNGGYTTLGAAWPDRAILTYEPFLDLVGV